MYIHILITFSHIAITIIAIIISTVTAQYGDPYGSSGNSWLPGSHINPASSSHDNASPISSSGLGFGGDLFGALHESAVDTTNNRIKSTPAPSGGLFAALEARSPSASSSGGTSASSGSGFGGSSGGLFSALSESAKTPSPSPSAGQGPSRIMDVNSWDSIPQSFFETSAPKVPSTKKPAAFWWGDVASEGGSPITNPGGAKEWDYSQTGLDTGADPTGGLDPFGGPSESVGGADVFLPLADHSPGSTMADQIFNIYEWSVPPVSKDTATYAEEPTPSPKPKYSDGESMARAILRGQAKLWSWTYGSALEAATYKDDHQDDYGMTCCQRLPYICGVDGVCVIELGECREFCSCASNPGALHCLKVIPRIKRTMRTLERRIIAKVAKELNMTTPAAATPVPMTNPIVTTTTRKPIARKPTTTKIVTAPRNLASATPSPLSRNLNPATIRPLGVPIQTTAATTPPKTTRTYIPVATPAPMTTLKQTPSPPTMTTTTASPTTVTVTTTATSPLPTTTTTSTPTTTTTSPTTIGTTPPQEQTISTLSTTLMTTQSSQTQKATHTLPKTAVATASAPQTSSSQHATEITTAATPLPNPIDITTSEQAPSRDETTSPTIATSFISTGRPSDFTSESSTTSVIMTNTTLTSTTTTSPSSSASTTTASTSDRHSTTVTTSTSRVVPESISATIAAPSSSSIVDSDISASTTTTTTIITTTSTTTPTTTDTTESLETTKTTTPSSTIPIVASSTANTTQPPATTTTTIITTVPPTTTQTSATTTTTESPTTQSSSTTATTTRTFSTVPIGSETAIPPRQSTAFSSTTTSPTMLTLTTSSPHTTTGVKTWFPSNIGHFPGTPGPAEGELLLNDLSTNVTDLIDSDQEQNFLDWFSRGTPTPSEKQASTPASEMGSSTVQASAEEPDEPCDEGCEAKGGFCIMGKNFQQSCVVVEGDGCDQFPCTHGECVSTDGVHTCECDEGWMGSFCDRPCTLDCGTHGYCGRVDDNDTVGCICHWNYTGYRCEDIRKIYPKITEVAVHDGGLRAWEVAVVAVVTAVVLALICVLLPYILWRRQWLPMRKLIFYFQEYEDDDEKEYDAFISYKSTPRDERFILQHLYPKLEKELDFRLCLHFRDFPPGEPIANNIIRAVENSRRTIMVLSPSYVASEWCRMEYQKAQHEMLKLKHKIIPIVLEDVKGMPEMDKNLKTIIDTVTYIDWPGEEPSSSKKLTRFWKLLELSMPKKKSEYSRSISSSGSCSSDVPLTSVSKTCFNSIVASLTEEDIRSSSTNVTGSSNGSSCSSEKTASTIPSKHSSPGKLKFPEVSRLSHLGNVHTISLTPPPQDGGHQNGGSLTTGSDNIETDLSAGESSSSLSGDATSSSGVGGSHEGSSNSHELASPNPPKQPRRASNTNSVIARQPPPFLSSDDHIIEIRETKPGSNRIIIKPRPRNQQFV